MDCENCGAATALPLTTTREGGEECGGMDVLVVEKDTPLREVIVGWLRGMGVEAAGVACGKEALAMADAACLPPVVVAEAWPGAGRRTGPALGDTLRRRAPGIGLVLISGNGTDPPRHPSGARDRCLPAPFPLTALLRAIREVTPGGGPARRR
jgi:CheY-like chemotaxis protein